MKEIYLAAAILVICVAHFIRMKRWKLFVEIYEEPNERTLLQSLSLGYLINCFVPFKIGDLVRAFYAGKSMKNGRTLALTTVIIDRYLDIVVIGVLYALITLAVQDHTLWVTTGFYMGLTVFLIVGTIFIMTCRSRMKKILMTVAEIFNPKIELRILKFSWSLIANFKDIFTKISKKRLLQSTVCMWMLYIASYFLLAQYLFPDVKGYGWIDIFIVFFAKSSIEIGTLGLTNTVTLGGLFTKDLTGNILYFVLPIFLLFGISFSRRGEKKRLLPAVERTYLNLLPQIDDEEKRRFLQLYFSDEKRDFIKIYLKINQNISIIQDFSAGSNATTMLCMNSREMFFRKYAFGEDGKKLYEQMQWIERYQGMISLPRILEKGTGDEYCYYDMPYSNNAVGLFTYAHSMPEEKTWRIIENALKALERSIYQVHIRAADVKTIQTYVVEKVEQNLKKIKEAKQLRGLIEYQEIVINGISYPNLGDYMRYLTSAHLTEVFQNDRYSEIHGDLTIENIICMRNETGQDEFYLIDPNTGNVHESANLDYGKLLQSLHGGYEFLMATKSFSICENRVDFTFTKSVAYAKLHRMLRAYLFEKFPHAQVKSIYYHEVIHWLRLLPYKISRDGKRAVLFYAGLLMVLNDVVKEFER